MIDHGVFVNSRKFYLSRIADVDTLFQYLNPECFDEIVLLNVTRMPDVSFVELIKTIERFSSRYFIPIAAGGGIQSFEQARALFSSGADRIVLNTALYNNTNVVSMISDAYGSQSIIGSIDVRKSTSGYIGFYSNGSKNSMMNLEEIIHRARKVGVGELLVRSIDNDGSLDGYDHNLIELLNLECSLPYIIAGGGGSYEHIMNAFYANAKAVNVGNLFHFVGESFLHFRGYIDGGSDTMPNMWNY